MKNLADTSLNQSNRRISANGFSLLELLITLSIIAILFGMMVPTFKGVRGTAEKLMCANNMRLIYYGLHGYANDNNGRLPYSAHAEQNRLQETMALTTDPGEDQKWDGLGLLWYPEGGGYLDNCNCLFCPSHHGHHLLADAQEKLNSPSNFPNTNLGDEKLYCNYQYSGDQFKNGKNSNKHERLFFNDAHHQNSIILTDGMRTASDFNHINGGNALSTVGSIEWFAPTKSMGYNLSNLPVDQTELPLKEQADKFNGFWISIQDAK